VTLMESRAAAVADGIARAKDAAKAEGDGAKPAAAKPAAEAPANGEGK
jgi:hypothetical protein